MINFLQTKRFSGFFRGVGVYILLVFTSNAILPPPTVFAQPPFELPIPGSMLQPSPSFNPTLIKGLRVDPGNPLQFDFIVDLGDSKLRGDELKVESNKLIKYFLAALTVPENELWVNLSPYEKDRIIPDSFGITEMGRDLLAQDYILKQLTASLVYPEDGLGRQFWDKIYQKAQERFGTTDIPVNTFNKVWIVPEKAVVYENEGRVYILENKLKVMLEEDYEALSKNSVEHQQVLSEEDQKVSAVSSEVVREILIPEIEKEVNTGKNFAPLRQMFYSLILATWYKQSLKESLLGKIYIDQNKVVGVDINDKKEKLKIYDKYLEAFKTGVYDYIKEEFDPKTQDIVNRKYFSGGVWGRIQNLERKTSSAQLTAQDEAELAGDNFVEVSAGLVDAGELSDPEYLKQAQSGPITLSTEDAAELSAVKTDMDLGLTFFITRQMGVQDESVAEMVKIVIVEARTSSKKEFVMYRPSSESAADILALLRKQLSGKKDQIVVNTKGMTPATIDLLQETIEKNSYGFSDEAKDSLRERQVKLMVRQRDLTSRLRTYGTFGVDGNFRYGRDFSAPEKKEAEGIMADLETTRAELDEINKILRNKTSADIVEAGEKLGIKIVGTPKPQLVADAASLSEIEKSQVELTQTLGLPVKLSENLTRGWAQADNVRKVIQVLLNKGKGIIQGKNISAVNLLYEDQFVMLSPAVDTVRNSETGEYTVYIDLREFERLSAEETEDIIKYFVDKISSPESLPAQMAGAGVDAAMMGDDKGAGITPEEEQFIVELRNRLEILIKEGSLPDSFTEGELWGMIRNQVSGGSGRSLYFIGQAVKDLVKMNILKAVEGSRGYYKKVDAGDLSKVSVDGKDNVGGIDFNPALLDLQIRRDGKGIPLPMSQQPFETMRIQGFLPVIINIRPVSNLPLFLGINQNAQTASTQQISLLR